MACQAPQEISEPPLRTVRTVTVEPTEGGTVRTFSGTSKSKLESRLSFKVSGTLQALPINVGDSLRRGQLIGRLDSSIYDLEVQQSEASLVQAQAAERNAAAAYDRVRGLYADNNASRNDLDTARANAESSEAQVRAAGKQLEVARLNASYTRLTAAEDCTVASIEAEVNENVSPGNPVATVTCGDAIDVEMSVPESLIAQIRQGMAATVKFDAMPGRAFPGQASEVGVHSSGGAAFKVTVAISGEHPGLRSGLAAEVAFQFGDDGPSGGYLVPLSAVVRSGESNHLFVLEVLDASRGKVSRRQVELGELTEGGMEVIAGLETGEQVVTAGTAVIRDGLVVALDASSFTAESGE